MPAVAFDNETLRAEIALDSSGHLEATASVVVVCKGQYPVIVPKCESPHLAILRPRLHTWYPNARHTHKLGRDDRIHFAFGDSDCVFGFEERSRVVETWMLASMSKVFAMLKIPMLMAQSAAVSDTRNTPAREIRNSKAATELKLSSNGRIDKAKTILSCDFPRDAVLFKVINRPLSPSLIGSASELLDVRCRPRLPSWLPLPTLLPRQRSSPSAA